MSEPVSFEKYFETNEKLIYTNKGTSMFPLIREGKDLLIIEKRENRKIRKGDAVLYTRSHGEYVLHRVVKVREDGYVIIGDNSVKKEYGVTDDRILGVMTGFVRNGVNHSTDELIYRLYSFILVNTVGIRVLIKRSLSRIKGLFKKVRQ